jgi:hypothetical protein
LSRGGKDGAGEQESRGKGKRGYPKREEGKKECRIELFLVGQKIETHFFFGTFRTEPHSHNLTAGGP